MEFYMSGAVAKSRIAVIVGSNRKDSLNRKLARARVEIGAGRFDAVFLRIDDLPLYDQHHELVARHARLAAGVAA
jgi:chromate reductase